MVQLKNIKKMSKIPTAEEKLKANFYNGSFIEIHSGDFEDLKNIMIEFAKLHVKAALEKAFVNSEMRVSENDTNEYPSFTDNYDDGYVTITVSKDSILNAYPLENIK